MPPPPVCRPLARLRRPVPYPPQAQILRENFHRKLGLCATPSFEVAVSTTSPIELKSTKRRRNREILSAEQQASVSRSFHPIQAGEMAEWLKAHAWKACLGETLTWVRIPLSPPALKSYPNVRFREYISQAVGMSDNSYYSDRQTGVCLIVCFASSSRATKPSPSDPTFHIFGV